MKVITGLVFLFSIQFISAQSIKDTVKIKEVVVQDFLNSDNNQDKIDSVQINNPVNANLGELIQQNSSAFVRSFGIGSTATVSFRGAASSHSQLLWNGITLNSSTNGVVDFSLFPTEFFQDISVLEGISSLQNSSGALGGSVELNQSSKLKEGLKISHSIGSFGWNRSHFQYIDRYKKWTSKSQLFYTTVENNFSFTDYGSPIFNNGVTSFPEKELQNARLEQLGIKQDFGYKINNKNSIGLELWFFDSFRQLPNIFTVSNAQEQQEDRSIRLQFNGKHYFKKSNLKWASSISEDEILYQNFAADLLSFSENKSWRSYANYELNFSKILKWNSRLNIDFDQATNDGFENKKSQNRLSYFTELKYMIHKNIRLDFGGRLEYISESNFFAMPFSSLVFKRKKYELILNGGRNIKYPNLNDLFWVPGGNPDLLAEESLTSDFTIKSNLWDKEKLKVKSSISTFYNHIDNYILWKPTQFGYWQPINLRAVYSKGINLGLESKYLGQLKSMFKFNYTLTRSRSLHQINQFDDSKNKQLIYLPEHQINSTINLVFKTIFMTANYQFSSARFLATDYTSFLPYYQLFDLTIGKSLKYKQSNFNLSFAIQNLMDEEYQAMAGRPMPGRNYLLKLSYELPK